MAFYISAIAAVAVHLHRGWSKTVLKMELRKEERAPVIALGQVIPTPFTLFRPYLAHFCPVFSRVLRVFPASPRRFQRAASRKPGPKNMARPASGIGGAGTAAWRIGRSGHGIC